MENSSLPKDRHEEHLGVNKVGKNIRKSPLHQPNFNNTPASAKQQSQPQVYNISKSDFRNVVQQLTGSPLRSQEPRPPQNLPKPPSMRLQKIRPPPLMPFNRTHIPGPRPRPIPAMVPDPAPAPAPASYSSTMQRAPQFGQFSPTMESHVSAYMQYLQSSIVDSGPPRQNLPYQPQNPQVAAQFGAQPPPSALLTNPPAPLLLSPRMHGTATFLPSPTSQFLLPSPGFLNMFSPRSPMPLPSPGYHFPPPLTPLFPFSPVGQPGILGPGPQPPLSPGTFFPLSPSALFPSPHPRWRDQ